MLEERLPHIIARADEYPSFRCEDRIDPGGVAGAPSRTASGVKTYVPDSSNAMFHASIAVIRDELESARTHAQHEMRPGPDTTSPTNSCRTAFYGRLTAIRLSTA